MSKKLIFQEDGTVKTVFNSTDLSLSQPIDSSNDPVNGSSHTIDNSSNCNSNAQKLNSNSSALKRKRKFNVLCNAENEFLKLKYGSSKNTCTDNTTAMSTTTDNVDGTAEEPGKDTQEVADKKVAAKDNTDTNGTTARKENVVAIDGTAIQNHIAPSSNDQEIVTSKAKTAALEYLSLFIKNKEKWKFQKVRQIWLLQNMYFSIQLDNEQFKDCKCPFRQFDRFLTQHLYCRLIILERDE